MPQNYAPEFKRRSSVSMKRKDAPTKALLLSMAYPKPASLSGAVSYVKNARQAPKPKKNMMP